MHNIVVDNAGLVIKKDVIIKDINLNFESGKIYGLYGRNGSGKTVLMKCIIGLMKLSNGKITYDGKVIGKDMDFISNAGILIEEPGFYNNYSGMFNLKLFAGIKNKTSVDAIRQAMIDVGLDPDSKKKVGKYSLGMRKRLGIAQAIMENPDVLILDEPTSALDSDGVIWFRDFILRQKEMGKMILITSHIKEDIEILCDEVFKLEKGCIVY